MEESIDVSALRVGMYVHLDLGWMAHPFPLSSFRIGSAEQIATIRGLGLAKVRWSPQRSDAPTQADAVSTGASTASATMPPEVAAAAAPNPTAAALAAQHAAQSLAEAQYGEASRAWEEITQGLLRAPRTARGQAEALTQALLDKLLPERQICIRLLTEGAGDRATAHALNVSIVALLMGHALQLPAPQMVELGLGALLHDIGKLELPGELRFADEGFSASVDLAVYREHVALGVEQGRRMGLRPGALLVIAQHHEQADGAGFPQQLRLERMSEAARIVALVNRYDNLCNPGNPARALTPHEALSLLFSQGAQKYDPTLLNGFVRMMGVYPPGSLVQLTDDRYAMVVAVDSTRPLKPQVLLYDPKVARDEALHLDLQQCPDLGIRRSLKPAQLPPAALAYLSPGRRIAYFFESGAPLGVAPSAPANGAAW